MMTCGITKRLKQDRLMWFVIVLQSALCCAFATLVEYGKESNGAEIRNSYDEVYGGTSGKNTLPSNYYMFQDVHVMVFIGFGFLLMLLKRPDQTSVVASYFLVTSISLQWGTLCYGFFHTENGKIRLDIKSLLNADFACAGVLISCAAVVDIATPFQLVFMASLEVLISATNKWLCTTVLEATDVGSSMFVHVFGAYFGLAVGFVLHRFTTCTYRQLKNEKDPSPSTINSALIGTMILWLLWPSFNACMAEGHAAQFRAIINTYYSLSASCVTAFAVSTLVRNCKDNGNRHKFNTVLFHNSTLVGGVAIGTSADMVINIWGAMIVGGAAGAGSVFVDRFFNRNEAFHRKLGFRDAWGVNTLHGIPGIVSGLVGAVVSAMAENVSSQGRTAWQQAGHQIAALAVTLAFAVIGGLTTGSVLLLTLFRHDEPNTEENSQSDPLAVANQAEETEPIIILTEISSTMERNTTDDDVN